MVDMAPLKSAVERLPVKHPLRQVLSGEPDRLRFQEYAAKVLVWIKLLHTGEDRE